MTVLSWDAALEEAAALRGRGELEAADEAYGACLRLAEEAADADRIARAAIARAGLHFQRGLADEAIGLADQARSVAAEAGLVGLVGRATNLLGIIALQRQDWSRADQHFQSALELAYESRDDELVGAVCMNLGTIKSIEGELREARGYYLESIGSAVRTPDRAQLVMSYNNLGMVCSDLEEWMEALTYFARGIEIAEETTRSPLLALLHVNQAEPLIEIGDIELALASLQSAERHATRNGNHVVLVDCGRYRGRISRLQRSWEEAERQLAKAMEYASEERLPLNLAELLEEQALLYRDMSDYEMAVERCALARDGFLRVGALRDLARVQSLEAELSALADARARQIT